MKQYNGMAGYEGFLNQEIAALPEILSNNGYFTLMAGKWHLGMRTDQGPWNRGFKKAFAMLPGCCNHYGWEPVQERFPVGGRPIHAEDGVKVDVAANKTEDPHGFYSTNTYTKRLLDYFRGRTEAEREQPFIGFLPFTTPHWLLQCSKKAREKYIGWVSQTRRTSRAHRPRYLGVYDDRPNALRKSRLQNLEKLGIISPDVVPHEMVDMETEPWDDLSAEEKKISSRTMETYAGMVDSIDHNVGKVVDSLKQTGEYDNTFIIFMSDNGAEGAAFEAIPTMSENIMCAIASYYDNSIDNIGSWNSYTWTGPSWAQASTAPSHLFKCWPSEGGILVPCVVKPPKGSFEHNFRPGSLNRSFMTCMDYAPTFLDMAGISFPRISERSSANHVNDDKNGCPQDHAPVKAAVKTARTAMHRGQLVYPHRGRSWTPFFSRGKAAKDDETFAIYPSDDVVSWELFARAALRKGEMRDLSEENSDKMEELLRHWEEYVVEYGIVWGEQAMSWGADKEDKPDWHDNDLKLQEVWVQTEGGQWPTFVGLDVSY